MTMHTPPHPGEFITDVYLEPNGISSHELAATLGVAPSTLNRVLPGSNAVSHFAAVTVQGCFKAVHGSGISQGWTQGADRRMGLRIPSCGARPKGVRWASKALLSAASEGRFPARRGW